MKALIIKFFPHRLLTIIAGAWMLALAALPASAIIDADLQMQLGNPSGATNDPSNHYHYLIKRSVETIDYSDYYGQPNWASWDLTSEDVGSSGRTDNWASDTDLPSSFYQVPTTTYGVYNGTRYDRGHMCPSADRTDTDAHNELVFIMSNIIPQASNQNQHVWANFENYCRSLLSTQELLITCGPSSFGPFAFDNGHVALASNTWKIVVGLPLDNTNNALNRITNADPKNIRVIALLIPNTDAAGPIDWSNFATTTRAIEIETGFTFFSALPNNLAWNLRSKVDGQAAAAPTLASFSPASGIVGDTVTLSGSNLGFITNVTFNGTKASFTINSFTNITATVPAAATSGSITVAGLGGNATSAASFSVSASSAPDLAVTVTHAGNFTQGDAGDTCTIIVTNVGVTASSGAVSVTNALPAGLTATAMSGTGWTADLGTLSCTRSDSLAAGSAYPAITVTVTVATNAATSVTNVAIVSGGGETNTANNTASDRITINTSGAPIVSTGTAGSLGTTTATLNGTVNPNGQTATAYFEYGLTASYGSTASVAGSFSGTATQAVSATVTGLTAGTTYHFRVGASNMLGSAAGLDQTFTTASAGVPDLAISVSHSGNFTQGDTGDAYTIIVTNAGAVASSGSVTVTNFLPAGLTATGISGSGWATNLTALTCTRSDALAGGAAYPAITVLVSVASNAPASVTNVAVVSGGGETNLANNTAYDPTTINALSNGSLVILAGWDVSTLSSSANGFGPSPFAPTTNAANLTLVGLTRGSGVGTNGTAASRAWGGNAWTNTAYQDAITGNHFATFGIAANTGYKVSFSSISKFDYRRSSSGPTNGLLQCQVGSAEFTNIATVFYPTNTSSGGSLGAIDLTGIPLLQNVGAGTNVTFRIVNWGGTTSSGTWYIFDVDNNTNSDFVVQGTVSQVVTQAADLAVSLAHTGDFTQGDTGRTYTVTVSNSGAAATAGSVTVTNILPSGLVATSLSGTGWTTNLGSLTCTRSDTLAAGGSYPPITLTVNVLTNAPASVTNQAWVSGGGESSTSNNTASDPTTILPAAAPTVTTGLATAISTTTATLNGMLTPNSQPAAAQFQYGLTSSYGSVAPVPGTFNGTATQAVNAAISGLLSGTTYHFRLTATNVIGEANGPDQVFTTLTPIEAWRLQYFGTTADSGAAADTAIATSDGMPNLLKYALGLDPLVATNDPVAGDISTGYLRLTAPKNPDATDVSFHVEVTTNIIGAWTTNGTTVDVNTATLLQAHANTPVAGSDAGYIRLRVSRP